MQTPELVGSNLDNVEVVSLSSRLMSDEPDFLICLTCETPNYDFEYVNGKLTTVLCNTCGNEDPAEFMTEAEFEEMA